MSELLLFHLGWSCLGILLGFMRSSFSLAIGLVVFPLFFLPIVLVVMGIDLILAGWMYEGASYLNTDRLGPGFWHLRSLTVIVAYLPAALFAWDFHKGTRLLRAGQWRLTGGVHAVASLAFALVVAIAGTLVAATMEVPSLESRLGYFFAVFGVAPRMGEWGMQLLFSKAIIGYLIAGWYLIRGLFNLAANVFIRPGWTRKAVSAGLLCIPLALAALAYSQHLSRKADNLALAISSAEDLAERGMPDRAITQLKELARTTGDDLFVLWTLGNIQRSTKRWSAAIESYSKAIKLVGSPQPDHWTIFFGRGASFERMNRWPEAEADFKKALELSPREALVLNYYGYSLVNLDIDLDRGLELLKKAYAEAPENGYIVDSLGWAYYKLGQYPKAIQHLENAVKLSNGDALILDHLADAYWKAGRQTEAQEHWRRALTKKVEAKTRAEVQRKLESGLQ